MVRFVSVEVFQIVALLPVRVQVPEPMVRVLVLALEEEKSPRERF